MKQQFLGAAARILGTLRPIFGRRRTFLIVSSDDTGSVGDQAMTESIRSVVADRYGYDVALMHPAAISAPVELLGPVRHLSKPETQEPASRLVKAWRRGVFHMARPNRFGFLGADVIDGCYSERKVLQILTLLDFLMKSGASGRIFGASVSEARSANVMKRLGGLPGLTFNARDPLSFSRFEDAAGRKAVPVADLAFNLTPKITSSMGQAAADWVTGQKAAGQFILGANINGYTVGQIEGDGPQAYVDLLSAWLSADPKRSVLILPHDGRPFPTGDIEPCQACFEALAPMFPDRVEMLRPPLKAWELKHLAGMADVVMSGRMHLAIAALGMGTPPLCVAYLNKFEGLFQLFGIEGLVVNPDTVADTDAMLAKLEELVSRREELEAAIEAKLPEVMALSLKNFDGLER